MRKELDKHNQEINLDAILKELDQDNDSINNDSTVLEPGIVDQLFKESMQDEFSVKIPEDFADLLCEKIEKRNFLREGIEKFLIMTLGLIGIPGMAMGLLFYTKSQLLTPIIQFLIDFKWPLIFAILCFTIIQMADLYFVKSKEEMNN